MFDIHGLRYAACLCDIARHIIVMGISIFFFDEVWFVRLFGFFAEQIFVFFEIGGFLDAGVFPFLRPCFCLVGGLAEKIEGFKLTPCICRLWCLCFS